MDSDETPDGEATRGAGATSACDDAPLDWRAIREIYGVDPNAGRDWQGIECAFVKSDLSLERIGQAFGVSGRGIGLRAKKEGWVREVGTKPLRGGRASHPAGTPKPNPPRPAEVRRRRMVARLYRVLDDKMTALEQRIAQSDAPQSAADAERDARTLASFARLYAKLSELDEAATRRGDSNRGADTGTRDDDADRFRRELATRLERLNQARNS